MQNCKHDEVKSYFAMTSKFGTDINTIAPGLKTRNHSNRLQVKSYQRKIQTINQQITYQQEFSLQYDERHVLMYDYNKGKVLTQ